MIGNSEASGDAAAIKPGRHGQWECSRGCDGEGVSNGNPAAIVAETQGRIVERVAFLVEEIGVRLSCLLNPPSLTVRRSAGVRPRRSVTGLLTGTGLADDPLLYTGGGRTELEIDLLFDVSLVGSSIITDDVRDLTGPLWDLAENASVERGYGRPPLVRLVWGKAWNVPAIVEAVAERLEQFTSTGAPQRAWLRMRLVRVGEPPPAPPAPRLPPHTISLSPESLAIPEDQIIIHEVIGGEAGTGAGVSGERLDEIAARYYGEPGLWRLLAAYNDIADPAHIPPPRLLRIPPLAALRGLG